MLTYDLEYHCLKIGSTAAVIVLSIGNAPFEGLGRGYGELAYCPSTALSASRGSISPVAVARGGAEPPSDELIVRGFVLCEVSAGAVLSMSPSTIALSLSLTPSGSSRTRPLGKPDLVRVTPFGVPFAAAAAATFLASFFPRSSYRISCTSIALSIASSNSPGSSVGCPASTHAFLT